MSVWSRQVPKQLVEAASLIVDGRKHVIRKTMWYNANFMRHAVGAPGKIGAITVTSLLIVLGMLGQGKQLRDAEIL